MTPRLAFSQRSEFTGLYASFQNINQRRAGITSLADVKDNLEYADGLSIIAFAFHREEQKWYVLFFDKNKDLLSQITNFFCNEFQDYSTVDWATTTYSFIAFQRRMGIKSSPADEKKQRPENAALYDIAYAKLLGRGNRTRVGGTEKKADEIINGLTDEELDKLLAVKPPSMTFDKTFKGSLEKEHNKRNDPSFATFKQECVDLIETYISCYKLSWFGHHHNARATAVRNAINQCKTIDQLKKIIASQTKFLVVTETKVSSEVKSKETKAEETETVAPKKKELLDARWTTSVKNTPNPKAGFFKIMGDLEKNVALFEEKQKGPPKQRQ